MHFSWRSIIPATGQASNQQYMQVWGPTAGSFLQSLSMCRDGNYLAVPSRQRSPGTISTSVYDSKSRFTISNRYAASKPALACPGSISTSAHRTSVPAIDRHHACCAANSGDVPCNANFFLLFSFCFFASSFPRNLNLSTYFSHVQGQLPRNLYPSKTHFSRQER